MTTFRPTFRAPRTYRPRAPRTRRKRASYRERLRDNGTLEQLLHDLFPNAKRRQFRTGGQLVDVLTTGDVDGNAGRSTTVYLTTGWIEDWNGDSLDVIDVVKQRYGLGNDTVGDWLRSSGYLPPLDDDDEPVTAAPPVPPKRPPPPEPKPLGVFTPAPAGTPKPTADQLRRLAPQQLDLDVERDPIAHVYRRADGCSVMFVARYFLAGGGKELRRGVWSGRWCYVAGGTSDKSVPLYRLPELLASDGPVLVVEGEKAADAGARNPLLREFTVTCPLGGSNPAEHTDWTPLAGRSVVVVPDHDDAGAKFVERVQELLPFDTDVVVVDAPTMHASLGGHGEPPAGWDIADDVVSAPEDDDVAASSQDVRTGATGARSRRSNDEAGVPSPPEREEARERPQPMFGRPASRPREDAAVPLTDKCGPVCDGGGMGLRHYCSTHSGKPIAGRALDSAEGAPA